MKKLEEMNNKELEKVNHITLIIALILEIATIIENIVRYDSSYSPAVIILGSIAVACAICAIIDQIKRDKFNNKKGK